MKNYPVLLFFTLPRSPFRFDLYDFFTAGSVVTKAGPQPVFGAIAKLFSDRIAVDVAQFLVELIVAADIEVVVPELPEVRSIADVLAGNTLFERLNCNREQLHIRLTE